MKLLAGDRLVLDLKLQELEQLADRRKQMGADHAVGKT